MRHNPSFYTSSDWRAFRAQVLIERPICETAGCGRKSEHVDHVIPLRRGGAPLDRRNVKARCHCCHSQKTARSDGGFGRPITPAAEPRAKGCLPDGTPRDPNHPWHRSRRA
jgi:5-methylcytosine-specific restriction protein A